MIKDKEKEKIDNYQDLAKELHEIWNVKVQIIPLVVGSLSAIHKAVWEKTKYIEITAKIGLFQKTFLLGMASILMV